MSKCISLACGVLSTSCVLFTMIHDWGRFSNLDVIVVAINVFAATINFLLFGYKCGDDK